MSLTVYTFCSEMKFCPGIKKKKKEKKMCKLFLLGWSFKKKQNKGRSEKIHLIIPDIQVNKQDKTKIFCEIFNFIAKLSSVQE